MGLQTAAGRPNSAHHLGPGAGSGLDVVQRKRTKDCWPLGGTAVGRRVVYWLQNLNRVLSRTPQDASVDSCTGLWALLG